VCLCVSLSAAARPHYCTHPDVTWGSGRGCPVVVHYWRICNRCTGCIAMKTLWKCVAEPSGNPPGPPHACHTRTKTPLAGDKIDAPAVCAIPFHPYCGGVVMQTRNVSEYMLVLALCLVFLLFVYSFVIMVALWNRADHYIFALWIFFLLSFFLFFYSPNLSVRRLDVYHTSTHGVALVRI